jgi:hypothetical protein
MKVEGENDEQNTLKTQFLTQQCFDNMLRLFEKICPGRDGSKALVMPKFCKYLMYMIMNEEELKTRNFSLLFFPFDKDRMVEWDNLPVSYLVFMIPPDTQMLTTVIAWSKSVKSGKRKNIEIHLVFYPQRTFMIKFDLKQLASIGLFEKIHDFNFDLIPLDNDLLSLEYKASLLELFVSREYNCHNMAAESLFRLETTFGSFKTVMLKGKHAKIVHDLKQSMFLDNERKFKGLMHGRAQ